MTEMRKTIVLTGASRGIGHATVQRFSDEGWRIISCSRDDVPELCSLAKAKAGDFLHHMSNELIQMHGGIGMTDEFDAGLYLKRARVLETALGNRAYHRDRYARLLGF